MGRGESNRRRKPLIRYLSESVWRTCCPQSCPQPRPLTRQNRETFPSDLADRCLHVRPNQLGVPERPGTPRATPAGRHPVALLARELRECTHPARLSPLHLSRFRCRPRFVRFCAAAAIAPPVTSPARRVQNDSACPRPPPQSRRRPTARRWFCAQAGDTTGKPRSAAPSAIRLS